MALRTTSSVPQVLEHHDELGLWCRSGNSVCRSLWHLGECPPQAVRVYESWCDAPALPTDSLRSLEFSSFSKISFHSKEYQSSDGARPKISGKVSGTVVDDDEGECNNTATEGESTNKDLSTQNAISNFFREDTIPAEKTICGTWKSCLLPNALIPVPQLVVVFCCIILPSYKISSSKSNVQISIKYLPWTPLIPTVISMPYRHCAKVISRSWEISGVMVKIFPSSASITLPRVLQIF